MKILNASLPSIDVCCPDCDEDITVDGFEFEPSLSVNYFAKAVVFCDACCEDFKVKLGAE